MTGLLMVLLFLTAATPYLTHGWIAEGNAYDQDVMYIPGEFLLGATFPIRWYGGGDDRLANGYKKCGDLETTFVLHAEVFRLSIEYVNEHILKNYTFGGWMLDECDNAIIGLQSVVQLLAGVIRQNESGICSSFPKSSAEDAGVIYAMIGSDTSVVSLRAEPLLEIYCLPLISSYASSPELDDMDTYPFFLRTVPTDVYQAQVVYDLLKHMKWNVITVVYEKTTYGQTLYEKLQNYVAEGSKEIDSVCIASALPISVEKPNYDEIIRKLEAGRADVVVMITDFSATRHFLRYIKGSTLKRKFQWVGTDGWSRSYSAVEDVEDIVENAVTIEFYAHKLPLIDKFLQNLTFEMVNTSTNPWLKKLVMDKYNCTFTPDKSAGNDTNNLCPRQQHVVLNDTAPGLERSHFVYEAVYAYALAVEQMRQRMCGADTQGLCEEFYKNANGTQLMKELKTVTVDSPDQLYHPFSFFNNSNSGPPYYSVFQLRRTDNTTNDYIWAPVGNWTHNISLTVYSECFPEQAVDDECIRQHSAGQLRANCREDCQPNQKRSRYETCCWSCATCDQWAYVNQTSDACVDCSTPMKPIPGTFDGCVLDELKYAGLSNSIFMALFIFGLFGAVMTVIFAVVLLYFRDTPLAEIVYWQVREFNFCLVLIAFLLTVMSIAQKPGTTVCVIQFTILPIIFTCAVATLLTKVWKSPKGLFGFSDRPRDSRVTQYIIIALVTAPEIAVVIMWAVLHTSTKFYNILREESSTVIACTPVLETGALFILFSIPTLILFVTFAYAFQVYQKTDVICQRSSARNTMTGCAAIILTFLVCIGPITSLSSSLDKCALQAAAYLLGTFALLAVDAPTIYVLLFQKAKNDKHYLTRVVKEDDRIRYDQLSLEEMIGEGYFCEVWKGRYERKKNQHLRIAAKKAKNAISAMQSANTADVADALLQEIVILRHVHACEHIVRLHGVCNDAESIILVFEYIEGESCRKFIPENRRMLIMHDLVSIIQDIVEAACFLKEKAIVHRDIQGSNCLVQRGAHAQRNCLTPNITNTKKKNAFGRFRGKLADFGVAMEMGRDAAWCRRSRLFPQRHTAPEGYLGQFSHASDVWSVGVFMWEVFTLMMEDDAIPYENVTFTDDQPTCLFQRNKLPKPEATTMQFYENIMKPCWVYMPCDRITVDKLKKLLSSAPASYFYNNDIPYVPQNAPTSEHHQTPLAVNLGYYFNFAYMSIAQQMTDNGNPAQLQLNLDNLEVPSNGDFTGYRTPSFPGSPAQNVLGATNLEWRLEDDEAQNDTSSVSSLNHEVLLGYSSPKYPAALVSPGESEQENQHTELDIGGTQEDGILSDSPCANVMLGYSTPKYPGAPPDPNVPKKKPMNAMVLDGYSNSDLSDIAEDDGFCKTDKHLVITGP